MTEELKVTNAQEYAKRFGKKRKRIKLPSGAVFEIRQIGVSDYLESGLFPALMQDEESLRRQDLRLNGELGKLMKSILITAVTAPLLCEDESEASLRAGKLPISYLSDEDFQALFNEIMAFSQAQPAPEVSLRHVERAELEKETSPDHADVQGSASGTV